MAKKCWVIKAAKPPKYMSRRQTRCNVCGRSRAVYRRFGICRICFRTLALKGMIPGVTKASW